MAERQRVGIVTDGAADGIRGENISVVPINILFGEDSYETGVDLSPEKFQELIEISGVIPITSVPNKVRFYDVYDKLVGGQNLDVVSIHTGSKFSGTCDMAKRIAKEYRGRVKVFDSGTVLGAQGLMATKAQEVAENGATSEEIIEMLTDIRERISLRTVIPNLDYIKKSSWISAAELFLGKMLGLIGVAQIDNNISGPVKIMGIQGTINSLTDCATKLGIPEQVVVLDRNARNFSIDLQKRLMEKGVSGDRVNLGELSLVSGSYGGPGTVEMVVLR